MNQNSKGFDRNSTTACDSCLTVIAKAAEEEMLRECTLWEREAGDIQVPFKTEDQILRLARKLEKKQLNKNRDRFLKRYAKTAAVVVLLLSISFAALLANADALRSEYFDFIFQSNDTYMKVIPVETGNTDAKTEYPFPPDWKEVYYPDYLPDGYQFLEAEAAGPARTIVFQNKEKETLILTQEPSEGAEILVDKENTKNGKTYIQGNPAYWTGKNEETTLIWNQYGSLFMLYGPIELEEMVEIAGHLLYVP